MSTERQRLGRRGERKAARFLKSQGLRVVQRNWRDRSGDELDLVMRDPKRDMVVFVEVRTQDGRSAGFAGGPVHSIGPEKRKKLWRACERWIATSSWKPRATRIDVVALRYLGWFRWEIQWFQNALQS